MQSSLDEPVARSSASRACASRQSCRHLASAESSSPFSTGADGAAFTPEVVPKAAEATAFLNEACAKVLLFSSLSDAELQTVIGAMFELRASAGQVRPAAVRSGTGRARLPGMGRPGER